MKKIIKEISYSVNFKTIGLKIKYSNLKRKMNKEIKVLNKNINELNDMIEELTNNNEFLFAELENYKRIFKYYKLKIDDKNGKKIKKKLDKEMLK